MNIKPLVSIGLPIYNGESHVREALESLLAQDYENFELIISDNCSTDATGAICQEVIAGLPNVHYSRNEENLGPMKNWLLVLERAKGEYFMWAAHDDLWTSQFITLLVGELERHPDAVLSTPAVSYINVDGTLNCHRLGTPPARGEPFVSNLKLLLDENCASWCYGVFRTDQLRHLALELVTNKYPVYGADIMWLSSICLRHNVVGNPNAVFFKRGGRGVFAPKTRLAQIASDLVMYWHLSQISLREGRGIITRLTALRLSWGFVYRYFLRYHIRSWLRLVISPLRRMYLSPNQETK